MIAGERRLTEKQKRFGDEYLTDLNATQAAIRAGYSEKTAEQMGYKLVQNSLVQAYIQQKQKKLQKKTEITQERVIAELAAVGFYDISDYANVQQYEIMEDTGETDDDGEPIYIKRIIQGVILQDTQSIPIEKRAAIAGIKQGRNGIEVKLNDKMKALEMLGKHLGMFGKDAGGTGDNVYQNMTDLAAILKNPVSVRELPDDEE